MTFDHHPNLDDKAPYAIEHYQQALVDNQITSKWCTWETFEDKELAEKELSNLLLRFDPATFRLTHSPD